MSESGVNETIAQIRELCYEFELKEAKRKEEAKKQELMENIVVDILKKAEGELDEASKERLWEIIKKERG